VTPPGGNPWWLAGGVNVDELQAIDELCAGHGPIFRRRPGVVYVAEPTEAKAILANEDGRYREQSDFFHTSKGTFGPRQVQLDIGAAASDLLRDHWIRRSATIAPERSVGQVSQWPDAGNLLLYHSFRDALVPPGELRTLVDQVVRHAVLAGPPERRQPMTVLRTRVRRALVADLSRRRARGERQSLLDVLAAAAPVGSSYMALAQLSEVYLSFVFAVAGWLGFVLGWSVYLLGTNPATEADPADVVREALRLWPVRWHFNRRPAQPHQLGDLPVTPTDEVVVCGYLVHRDETRWPDAGTFRPSRWSAETPLGAKEAFIPFGWGQHTCTAADLTIDVVADLLRRLPTGWHVTPHEDRPHVAATLAPPTFTLHLP
jgi:cytochrome P450